MAFLAKRGEAQHDQNDARQTPPRQDKDLTDGGAESSSNLVRDGVTSSPQMRGPSLDDRTRTEDENFHLPTTFVRPRLPQELLEQPYVISRKAGVNILVISPKHSGGGIVAGKLNVSV